MSNKVDNQNSLLSEEDPRIEISFLISDVTRRLRALYDVEMSQLGLSRAQWRALIGVLRLKAPTQTDLADALDIGRASMGSLIDHLEKNGFVARILDPNDRRVWRIVPTKIALGSIEPLDDAAQKVANQAFSSISDNDLSLANKVLAQIQKNLS